ncbi:hypothetical protein [Stackebrandtia soli]|uniref:VG15 protein n=1 Tax=Stackebrandtia soli TaxID=1892856 RepID=UPI0039EAB491
MFRGLFRSLLDPRRVDATAPIWLTVAERLVIGYAAASAGLAETYYNAHRAADLAHLGTTAADTRTFRPASAAVLPEPEAVRTSLLVCGPAALKHATANGRTINDAAAVAETRATAAATRHVLTGGRNTITRNVSRDPVALGWVRVTGAAPCWLCAMQASRGPVFKSRRSAKLTASGQLYHDGCRCTVEPIYSRSAAWPGNAREFAKLWKDSTRGLSGADARRAFRRAVDERNRPEPTDTADPEPTADDRNDMAPVPEPVDEPIGTAPEPEPEQPESPDALAGTDLESLSDGELFELFGQYADDETALAGIAAEMDRRDDDGTADEPAPDPLDGIALDGLGMAWLDKLATDHADRPDVVERIDAERARRAAAAQPTHPEPAPAPVEPEPVDDLTPEQERVNELVAAGWDWQEAYAEAYSVDVDDLNRQARNTEVDAHRQGGETREDTVRRLYREHVDLQYVAAEDATRGHMLSAEGEAAGIDPASLFSGPTARARLYASEDLQRWWTENGRTTFTEFRAQLLGREADKRAAVVTRLQSNARDFI